MENFNLQKIENINEQRWFSFLKIKAQDQKFGTMSFEIMVKKGKITSIKNIKQIENFNIES